MGQCPNHQIRLDGEFSEWNRQIAQKHLNRTTNRRN